MEFVGTISGTFVLAVLFLAGRFFLRATVWHRDTIPFQVRLFAIGIFVRFAFSLALYQFGLVSILGDFDSVGWIYGMGLWETWNQRGYGLVDVPMAWANAFQGNHLGYYYLSGTIFFLLGGVSRMACAAVNCFLGALTAVFAYRVGRTLFTEKIAVRVGWWVCLFPSMIIWSAQTIKEPVVILLEMVALYGCLRLKKRFAMRYVIATGASVIMIVPFRFYAAYITAAAVCMALVMPELKRGRSAIASGLGVIALVLVFGVSSGFLARGEVAMEQFDVKFIEEFRHNIAAGSGSGVEANFDMQTTTGFGLATFVGAAHLLLAPFPWQLRVGSLRMIMTTPELIYWWWLFFVGVVPGARYLLKTRFSDILPVLIFTIGLGLLYSMLFGNIGLIFRQRAQILPWLFLFGAVGLERREALKTRKSTVLESGRVFVPTDVVVGLPDTAAGRPGR